jgi:hypothetical protein
VSLRIHDLLLIFEIFEKLKKCNRLFYLRWDETVSSLCVTVIFVDLLRLQRRFFKEDSSKRKEQSSRRKVEKIFFYILVFVS